MKFSQRMIDRYLPPDSFMRYSMMLLSGTAIAQVVSFLASPILTRLYLPSEFGTLAVFSAIVGILAPISCLRYELSIVLPSDQRDSVNLFIGSLIINFIFVLVSIVIVILFGNIAIDLLNAQELRNYLWLFPISLWGAGAFFPLNYWGSRRGLYNQLAKRRITQTTMTAGTQVLSGVFKKFSATGLLMGYVLGQVFSSISLLIKIIKSDFAIIKSNFDLKILYKNLTYYKKYPLLMTWSSFMNTTSAMLPSLLLPVFFDTTFNGHFSLAFRVLALPGSLVGNSLSQVFFPRAVEAKRNNTLPVLMSKIIDKLLFFSIFPFMLIFFVGPDLFSVFFGAQWRTAGEIASWLSLLTMVSFVSSPISTIFIIFEKHHVTILIDFFLLLVRFVSMYIGLIMNSPMISIVAISISSMIIYIIALSLMIKISGLGLWVTVKKVVKVLKYVIFSIIPVLSSLYSFDFRSELIVVSSIISTIIYLFLIRHKILGKNLR